jgi:glycosyltransferase involved in cell wall biosynthesis
VVSNTSQHAIGIIIPAYNPDPAHLQELIERLQNVASLFPMQILVIDDGSEPRLQIPQSSKLCIQLSRHERNRGKGAALKTGFQYFFTENKTDYVVTLDADLQHPPEKIPAFIRAYQEGNGEVIIGYRKRQPSVMPLPRIISNTLTSLIISVLTGQLVRDSQCGFRLITRKSLEGIAFEEEGFHLESELLVLAGWKRVQFGFVEIPTIYQEEKSSINNTMDTLNFIYLILRIIKDRILGYV